MREDLKVKMGREGWWSNLKKLVNMKKNQFCNKPFSALSTAVIFPQRKDGTHALEHTIQEEPARIQSERH